MDFTLIDLLDLTAMSTIECLATELMVFNYALISDHALPL